METVNVLETILIEVLSDYAERKGGSFEATLNRLNQDEAFKQAVFEKVKEFKESLEQEFNTKLI